MCVFSDESGCACMEPCVLAGEGLRSRGVRGAHEWRSRRPVLAHVSLVPHLLMQGLGSLLAEQTYLAASWVLTLD